jgi:hypothetical protein
LLGPESLLSTPPTLPLTPPPEGPNEDNESEAKPDLQSQLDERQQFREAVALDFAAFDGNIVRIQLLYKSNQQERERYAAEKIKILETSQAVRDSTKTLRVQLEAAQSTLAQKKQWDDSADKITGSKMLKPREDQHLNIEKLHEEIANLEQESRDYAQTWSERREQFERIVKEGMELRRLIRDEKEEVERREGMEGNDETGERRDDVAMSEQGEIVDKDADDEKEEGEEDEGEVGEKMDTT